MITLVLKIDSTNSIYVIGWEMNLLKICKVIQKKLNMIEISFVFIQISFVSQENLDLKFSLDHYSIAKLIT